MNDLEEREEAKKKRQALPEKIKKRYSQRIIYAKRCMARISTYNQQFEIKKETVRDRKAKYEDHLRRKTFRLISMKKVGRPLLVLDEILSEIRSILSNLRISWAAIT